MAANRAQIKRELRIMAGSKAYEVYLEGIRPFLAQWPRKSDAEVKRLCVQIKEVIARSRATAVEIFGSRGVLFFERLDMEAVNWQ